MAALSLPWVAGFFDADGSVSIGRIQRVRNKGRIQFVPVVSISQSDAGILERIAEVLGVGTIHLVTKAGDISPQGICATRDSYNLLAHNKRAITAINILLPELVTKKGEALEVLRFYEKYNNYTKGWARWNKEEYEARYKEMVTAGDDCCRKLRMLRQNKDSIDVSLEA